MIYKVLFLYYWHLFPPLAYGAQLVPPNFSQKDIKFLFHVVCGTNFFLHNFLFSARLSFLARLFFSARLCFWHDVFFSPFFFSPPRFVFGTTFCIRHHFFSARPGQVTADHYYCSGMENMVIVIHSWKLLTGQTRLISS